MPAGTRRLELEFMQRQAVQPAECEANCAHHRPVRLSWARLFKRVFDLDLEHLRTAVAN